MARSATFKTVDRGANALTRRFAANEAGLTVKVGMLAKAQEPHEGGGDLTVADIGTIHEFGLGVQQRSFIRGWYDENQEENKRIVSVLQKQVLRGEVTQPVALNRFGLKCVGDIQRRIVAGIEPPLAQSTIDKKGSSTPLVDTGQLRASISHEVSK